MFIRAVYPMDIYFQKEVIMKYYFMYIGAVLALMSVVWAMPIYPPSFNILLTEDGSYTMMRGDPYANIILSQGNRGRILLHNLEPNTLYSARYSTLHCIQIMTNNNGNANSGQINDSEGYGFIYEWEERMRGGHHAELKE